MPAEQRNPHLDDDRVVWRDEYSGGYYPVAYDEQFDRQWQLFRKKTRGFICHAGAETREPWVDERIRELTGVDGFLQKKLYGTLGYRLRKLWRREGKMGLGSTLRLQPAFSIDHFLGKRCLDVGCGAGRWTKALMALGGKVKSTDTSENGLLSVRRFNDDVEALDLFELANRSDLQRQFDFTICWGVLMHTHDPKVGFEQVAATVAPGGELYTMIYAPEGMHNTNEVWAHRRKYHRELTTPEEKLQYAYELSASNGNTLGNLDMLNTFYNWVVPEETIHGWYRSMGFSEIATLNAHESPKCAYHVVGRRTGAAAAQAA